MRDRAGSAAAPAARCRTRRRESFIASSLRFATVGFPQSLCLDVGRPDHLAPLLGLLGNVFAEVGGRAWKHSATKVGKARLHLGIVESRVDLLVELVDDFGRRGLRCAEAVPNTPLVARQE